MNNHPGDEGACGARKKATDQLMFPTRFFLRLFNSFVILILVLGGTTALVIDRLIYQETLQEMEKDLGDHVQVVQEFLLAGEVNQADIQRRLPLLGNQLRCRLTYLDAAGTVLADSHADPAAMSNQTELPEIQAAREADATAQPSWTSDAAMMYCVLPTRKDGQVIGFLRAGRSLKEIQETMMAFRVRRLLVALGALGLAMTLAFFLARRCCAPLRQITSWAEGVSRGEYAKKTVDDQRLFGMLGPALENMAEFLHLATDDLEKQVQQRTAELAQSNQQLRGEIQERTQVEKSLRQSEERFRRLADELDGVVFSAELDPLRVIFFSSTAESIWEISPQTYDQNPWAWLDRVHPEDRRAIEEELYKVLQATEELHFSQEYRALRPDGQMRWMHNHGRIFIDPSDGRRRLTALAEDITERKEMELGLRQSEERFRRLADELDGVVYSVELDPFKVVFFSSAAERVWQMPGHEFERNPFGWMDRVHPADQARFQDHMHKVFQAGAEFQFAFEFRIQRPDGQMRWLYNHGNILKDTEGRRLTGLCEDVTERKEMELALRASEERFHRLADELDAEVFALELEPVRLLYASPRAVHGSQPPQKIELHPAFWLDYVHPEDRPRIQNNFQDNLAEQEDHHFSAEYRICRPDGQVRWVYSHGVVLRDPHDGRRRLTGLSEDITPRKEMEEALRRANEELEERVRLRTAELAAAKEAAESASRAKSDFLANISHEVRTPLNAILGLTDLLLDSPLTTKQRYSLQTVKTAGETLLATLNDVLDYARMESGRLEIETVVFSLRNLMEETLGLFRPQAGKHGLQLTAQLAEAMPDMVSGDPLRLRQILANLIGNALKFTPRGLVKVVVEVASQTAREAELHFMVRDTGIGIAADKQRLIFEPFTQADSSTTRKYGGSGLGLAITAHLVERLGGRIWVESMEGQGSCFHFTLPLELGGKLQLARPETMPARPLCILLVEDNSINQEVIQHLLSIYGHKVVPARNGQEAVGLAANNHFDLILMDLQMPIMDGYEAATLIRQDERGTNRRVPIIALTADNLKEHRERCLTVGMDGYLAKPIDGHRLRQAIARAAASNLMVASSPLGSYESPAAAACSPAAQAVAKESLQETSSAAAILDKAAVLDRLGGQAAALGRIVTLFRDDSSKLLAAINQGLATGQAREVVKAVHRLKGAAGNLGGMLVFQVAQKMERLAKNNQLAILADVYNELKDALGEHLAAMEEWQEEVLSEDPGG